MRSFPSSHRWTLSVTVTPNLLHSRRQRRPWDRTRTTGSWKQGEWAVLSDVALDSLEVQPGSNSDLNCLCGRRTSDVRWCGNWEESYFRKWCTTWGHKPINDGDTRTDGNPVAKNLDDKDFKSFWWNISKYNNSKSTK